MVPSTAIKILLVLYMETPSKSLPIYASVCINVPVVDNIMTCPVLSLTVNSRLLTLSNARPDGSKTETG